MIKPIIVGMEGAALPAAPAPTVKQGVQCHTRGDRCTGCLHYQGKAAVCEWAAVYAAPAPAAPSDARTLRIERPDDEQMEFYIGDVKVGEANHDEHGWAGMASMERLAESICRALATAPAAPAVFMPNETVPLARYREIVKLHHDALVTMQAALIEWKHGQGAEAGLQWIVNTLAGPGLLPDEFEQWGKDAQMWMNANRSDKMPTCRCGRPSHIGWMGQGFCSDAHYQQARAQGNTQQPGGEQA